MREAPLTDRQRIVKGLVVWTNVATAMTKLLLRRFAMRYSMMLLKLSTIVLLFGLLVTAPLSVALAAPIQGPKGQACKSTGTTTVAMTIPISVLGIQLTLDIRASSVV